MALDFSRAHANVVMGNGYERAMEHDFCSVYHGRLCVYEK